MIFISKKRLFLIGIIFFLLMFISGIYSLNDELNHTENGLSTSAVDIELVEFNHNFEPFTEDGKHVMPGDEILLIPRVNNLGIECYIRVKLTYTIDGNLLNEQDYITGNYASWNKVDDYYYYDSVLGREEYLDIFNKLTIPNISSIDYQGKNIVLHIVVDAIQAKNFDGNWDRIEIKKSIDRTYDINYGGESSVIYEDDIYDHIKLSDNYFGNLGNMLPGDSISEEIRLLNNSRNDNKYYLAIDYDQLSDDELKLLQKIKLVVVNSKGNILIDSNLADKNKHVLGFYQGGKGDTLTVTLTLPIDSDNDYSKLFTKIVWKFSYDTINYREMENPYTGDFKFNLSIAIFLLSALGFLIVLVIGSRNIDNIEKNKRKEEK